LEVTIPLTMVFDLTEAADLVAEIMALLVDHVDGLLRDLKLGLLLDQNGLNAV
jgi:hypothetical protein